LFRCDLSCFTLLIFILARFHLFRFHLVSVQDPKQKFYSFTKQTETEPKELGGFGLFSFEPKQKSFWQDTPSCHRSVAFLYSLALSVIKKIDRFYI
jgi:hypothetical protein